MTLISKLPIHTPTPSPVKKIDASKQTKQDKIPKIVSQVFGDLSCFPLVVKKIIHGYFTFTEVVSLSNKKLPFHATFSALSPFSKCINLTDRQVLAPCISSKYQDDSFISCAVKIAKRSYEAPIVAVAQNGYYGCAYPMNPEILDYVLKLKKDLVVQLAGGAEIDGLLLAFTDTKKILFNDIDQTLVLKCASIREEMPSAVKDKIELVTGNCLELLEYRPGLKNAVDVVLCRNLIPFFDQKQMDAFFTLLTKILKVGGSAILTATSKYSFFGPTKRYEYPPDASRFIFIECMAFKMRKEEDKVESYSCFGSTALVYSDHVFPEDESEFVAYEKRIGQKWTAVNNTEYIGLNTQIKAVIKKALNTYKSSLSSIPRGYIKIVINKRWMFDEITLSELVSSHGFEVESIFLTRKDGHLIDDDDLYGESRQIGILCKKPQKLS